MDAQHIFYARLYKNQLFLRIVQITFETKTILTSNRICGSHIFHSFYGDTWWVWSGPVRFFVEMLTTNHAKRLPIMLNGVEIDRKRSKKQKTTVTGQTMQLP